MNISAVNNIDTNSITSQINDMTLAKTNTAEEKEIQFALGEAENTHDLLAAKTKALTALQYTAAVRDKIIDAYKELMQMSI